MLQPITITCLARFENVLAKEIELLQESLQGQVSVEKITIDHQAVRFQTDNAIAFMYHANLRLRTAITVLLPITSFRANSADELYQKIYDINWQNYFNDQQTFAIQSSTHSKLFTHSHFVSLKVKDAIVDQFRDRTGRRPNVELKEPYLRLHVRIEENRVTVSRNSSGNPLFKRGYRSRRVEAPMNEVLAAGLVYLSQWLDKATPGDSKSVMPLVDPMTGGGTIAIEAAWMLLDIAPGLFRESFGFMNWPEYDDDLFQSIRNELLDIANTNLAQNPTLPIHASDSSPTATDKANENFANAGLEGKITLQTKPFDQLKLPVDHGMIIMNPPYGERMKKNDIDNFYAMIGQTLKQNFQGFTAWIFSANEDALHNIKLARSKRMELRNGPLDCTYQRYEVYSADADVSTE